MDKKKLVNAQKEKKEGALLVNTKTGENPYLLEADKAEIERRKQIIC